MRKFLATGGFILFVMLLISGSYLNDVRIQRNAVAEVLSLGGAVHYSDGLYLGGPTHPTIDDKPPYHDFIHKVWGVEIQKCVPPSDRAISLSSTDIAATLKMNWLHVLQLNKVLIERDELQEVKRLLQQTEISGN